jgi:hypothetical protein
MYVSKVYYGFLTGVLIPGHIPFAGLSAEGSQREGPDAQVLISYFYFIKA